MTPAGQHVHIKVDPAEVMSGRIIIPEIAQKRPPAGVVIAVSGDMDFEVQAGDRVVFERNAGCEMEGGLLSIPEDKILYKS
jgi:co-chaperonin GroES (HSP10)